MDSWHDLKQACDNTFVITTCVREEPWMMTTIVLPRERMPEGRGRSATQKRHSHSYRGSYTMSSPLWKPSQGRAQRWSFAASEDGSMLANKGMQPLEFFIDLPRWKLGQHNCVDMFAMRLDIVIATRTSMLMCMCACVSTHACVRVCMWKREKFQILLVYKPWRAFILADRRGVTLIKSPP